MIEFRAGDVVDVWDGIPGDEMFNLGTGDVVRNYGNYCNVEMRGSGKIVSAANSMLVLVCRISPERRAQILAEAWAKIEKELLE